MMAAVADVHGHGALALSPHRRREHSLQPHHFIQASFQLPHMGTKAAYSCNSASSVKYQEPSDS